MNPNLSTGFTATQEDRTRLNTQAERGWQADQAAVIIPRRTLTNVIGRSADALLVRSGQRLRATPRPVQEPAS